MIIIIEITDEQKKQIGIGIGVGCIAVVGITVVGFYFYDKIKKQQELERLIASGDKDIAENYQMDDRPRLTRLRDQEINTEFPQDYYNKRTRFAVLDSNFNNVSDRFKILETHSQAERQKGRFRASGDSGGYYSNSQKRNPNFSDLIIP